MSFNSSLANSTVANSTSGIGSNLTSNLTNHSGITTNSRLVHSNNVAPSSVTASGNSSSSNSSMSSTTPTVSDGSKIKNGASPGVVANPLSWKYGVALGAVIAGSFVLGSGL